MLSPKPWKLDALVRLVASIFLCFFAGAVLVELLHQRTIHSKEHLQLYAFGTASFVCLTASLIVLWRPWQLESVMWQMIVFLFCLCAAVVLSGWCLRNAKPATPSVGQMIIAALSFQGAALVFMRPFLREHRMSWREAFGFANRWPYAIMLGIIVSCLFLPLGWGLQWVSARVMMYLPRLHLKPEEQQAVQTLQMASVWVQRLALGLVTVVLAPVAEEILFRGILYPWIKQTGFPRLALWGSALLFAAVHVNAMTFVPLVVLALALTILYERTNNLLAPITAHALFNAMNFMILYSLLPRV